MFRPPPPGGEWFLSFDCATKSFAFALLRVRPPPPGGAARLAALRAGAAEAGEALAAARAAGPGGPPLAPLRERVGALAAEAGALAEETRDCLRLAAGGAADLLRGRRDREASTVERVRALVAYLREAVDPALAAAAPGGCPPPGSRALRVAVEYQMGPNSPARTVAAALVTYYQAADVFFVGPALKNRLWFPSRPDLRLPVFSGRYRTAYGANKAHARALYFEHVGKIFGHVAGGAAGRVPPALRKDFADCVLQVLGFLAFGDREGASRRF